MVVAALDLQMLFKGDRVIGRVGLPADGVLIPKKLEEVHLVQLAVLVQPMGLQGGRVQLLHLGIKPIVHKSPTVRLSQVLHIQMHELGAQAHHLRDAPDEVIRHLVAEAQAVALMLVQCNGPLAPPGPLVLLQLDLIVFLGVPAGRLAADLDRRVRHRLPIAHLREERAVLVSHLQQGRRLVAGHLHVLVVVDRIGIDLRPGMVGVLGFVPTGDGQIHGHNAAVVIDRIQPVIVPQVDAVIGLFFHRRSRNRGNFLRRRRFLRRGQNAAPHAEPRQCSPQGQHSAAGDRFSLHHASSFFCRLCRSRNSPSRVNAPAFSSATTGCWPRMR